MSRPSRIDPDVLARAIQRNTESRDSDRRLHRSSRDFVELIPGMTEKPDVEHLKTIIEQIQTLTGRDPRPGQVLALYLLLYSSRDILFQAATGYGKSTIWQCIAPMAKGICIMISPLSLLTKQQTLSLPKGCKGISLTHQNNSAKMYQRVAECEFTHGNIMNPPWTHHHCPRVF